MGEIKRKNSKLKFEKCGNFIIHPWTPLNIFKPSIQLNIFRMNVVRNKKGGVISKNGER